MDMTYNDTYKCEDGRILSINVYDVYTVRTLCDGLPYDTFMRFDVDIASKEDKANRKIVGGTWSESNIIPPTEELTIYGKVFNICSASWLL